MKWIQKLGKKNLKQKGGDSNEGKVEETTELGGEASSQTEGVKYLPAPKQLPLSGKFTGLRKSDTLFSAPFLFYEQTFIKKN